MSQRKVEAASDASSSRVVSGEALRVLSCFLSGWMSPLASGVDCGRG